MQPGSHATPAPWEKFLSELREAQQTDPVCRVWRAYLTTGELPTDESVWNAMLVEKDDFVMDDGVLSPSCWSTGEKPGYPSTS